MDFKNLKFIWSKRLFVWSSRNQSYKGKTHDTNNTNSGKILAKVGFNFEGVGRQRAVNNQGIVDIALYSYLLEDYKN